jgi:regulator of protease activity HflC (stomatin/prohibitin superfamily)
MADQLVTNALERGMVLAGATFSLTEFIDLRDTPNEAVQALAQEVLDALDSGIELKSVRLGQRTAPLAIRAQYRDVQVAREEAKEAVERARQEVATSFTAVAGEAAYSDLIGLIDDYNNALTGGETARADGLLEAIGERFENRDVGGSAARIINQARAYQSALETRLSSELRRIETLAPTYHENPQRFVQRIWLETYREVFENDQLEVFSMPLGLARIGLSIQSSEDIMQLRRNAELDRKKAAVLQQEGELLQGFQWGRGQIILEGPGRRLERNATGGLGREN